MTGAGLWAATGLGGHPHSSSHRKRGQLQSQGTALAFGVYMPITAYDFNLDPETKRSLEVALEITRMSLGLEDNLANGIITKQLIELAKAGERNPYQLCEGALSNLREHLFGD